jgi:hypothetical protein
VSFSAREGGCVITSLKDKSFKDNLTDDEIRQKIELWLEDDLEVSIYELFSQEPHLVEYLARTPNPRDDLLFMSIAKTYALIRLEGDGEKVDWNEVMREDRVASGREVA